ncbi:riboflavin synthase alpha chain [Bacteroidales bacterium 6E]|nr:riboflavin synthase alpha chain [Bacteroidales bacterium 6E]
MFSGIVEGTGQVVAIEREKDNVHFTLTWKNANELKIDQSLSHNGVCLTVVAVDQISNTYKVTAIRETLLKSNLGLLEPGSKVNLERSMPMNGRLDGHIVQGHVDQTAICKRVEEADGSWYYTFEYDFDKEKARQGYMTVEKGSVTVNGVSLTVVNSRDNTFQVAIIPYTWEVTNFHTFKEGTVVNLEFDIIGKYLSKLMRYQ